MRKYILSQTIYLLLFILFITCKAAAQPVCQIRHFSAYNGLAQRTVTNIVQDSKGLIWFSTRNGLNKFDGYTFKNYKAFPGDGCTLTSNRLAKITQTQTCDIWCQTYDLRIYLFDSRREKFIDILRPYENEKQQTYAVQNVYTLPKGVSWIVCDRGAFRIDEQAYKAQEGEGITLSTEPFVTFDTFGFAPRTSPFCKVIEITEGANTSVPSWVNENPTSSPTSTTTCNFLSGDCN